MPRRKKRLVDLVRDETFIGRKDEHLLGGANKLPWPELEKQRRRFRRAADHVDRREIALDLERGLRERGAAHYLGELRAELEKFGPPGSLQRLDGMGRHYFKHYAGPKAGKPFVFDKYQRAFLEEDTRRDKHGRVYQVSILMAPKGSGKTPFGAVLGAEAYASAVDTPEVYNLAGAKDQAGFCHDFASENIRDGALAAWWEVGGGTIYDPTKPLAEWSIMTSDGDLSAGVKPTKSIFDELFQYVHRKQREQWNSHTAALHKRPGEASALGMSTAGWDKQTLLGEIYDGAIAHPKLEVRNDGYLLVLRDEEAGFLFWCYQAPDDADIEDPKVIRAANPAPWVSPRDLLKELHRTGTREADWRRLHLNQWTATKEAWLPAGTWRALSAETEIPRGADVYVAVDAAKTYDTTACAWAYRTDSGGIILRAKVWSAREGTPYHEFVPGGRIRNSLVEDFIAETLAKDYRVREVVYDPRYFDSQGERLAERGLIVAEFPQASAAMADAYQHFYEACLAGTIVHNGDAIFAKHIDAAAAVLTETGWRVYKLRSTNPIDALVAAAMARERAARGAAGAKPFAFHL